MAQKVLIIGGGLGGLVCGAILAKEGYSVRIFEKHTTAGGGLHTFMRYGVEWETGMHVISGFQQNGALRRLFSYLEIFDKLHIKPKNSDGFDVVYINSDGRSYKMAAGRKNFVETLGSYFPEEKDNIRRYIDRVYEICDNIELFNLKTPASNNYEKLKMTSISVNELIASYVTNPKLQTLLAYNVSLYGGEFDKTPAFVGALITQFYIEGASRFVAGSRQLADALIEVIEQNGGEVITGNGVNFIDVHDKKIQKIIADDGREFSADRYISAIHPSTMFKLMDITKMPTKAYRQRIDSIPNSYSSFITFIKFKPNTFPYLNYSAYYVRDYSLIWKGANYDGGEEWPHGCMCDTPPVTEDDKYAQKMIISAAMNFDDVRKWENTTVEKRGDDYIAFKKQYENKLIDAAEKLFPDLRSAIDDVFSATPLTIRDYYGAKEGAIYGTKLDCQNFAASQIPVRTKLNNLLLTGQNINLHGILGVPVTSVLTCAELLGLEYLIKAINNVKTRHALSPTKDEACLNSNKP